MSTAVTTAWLLATESSAPDAGHICAKVIEAEKTAQEITRQAIEMVRALYAVEKQAATMSAAKKLEMRQVQSVPVTPAGSYTVSANPTSLYRKPAFGFPPLPPAPSLSLAWLACSNSSGVR
jgi:hypothetical protein